MHVTDDPGGTTIVVFLGGVLELKLRQPPRLSGIRQTISSFFIVAHPFTTTFLKWSLRRAREIIPKVKWPCSLAGPKPTHDTVGSADLQASTA